MTLNCYRKSLATTLAMLIFSLGTVWGCSTSSENNEVSTDSEASTDISTDDTSVKSIPNDHRATVEQIVAILPSNVRGAMAIDLESLLESDAAAQIADLLSGKGSEAALGLPLQAIKKYALGMNLEEAMQTAVLATTTDPQKGFALVAKLSISSLDELRGLTPLEQATEYNTFELHNDPASGLSVTMLPGGLFIAGNIEILKDIIDTYRGEKDGASASAVGPYLRDLASDHPLAIVYGLPGLYKDVEPSLTLNGALATSVWLELSEGMISGEATFFMPNAKKFSNTYNQKTKASETQQLTTRPAGEQTGEGLVVPIEAFELDKSADEVIASRQELKKLFYVMEANHNTSQFASGKSLPWKSFFVDQSPPSIFINWEIPESQVEAFGAAVLPEGFEMMPLRILETDSPAYYLVLNTYTTRGLVSGVRYEWSIFVKDPVTGVPRFMVIEALAEGVSMDPVNLLTEPDPVSHVLENGQLESVANKKDGEHEKPYFSSTINWPAGSPVTAKSAREFVRANDYIFWGGGVADRGLYSGGVYNRDVVVIPKGDYQITDNTPWSTYIDPEPRSVYAYQNSLDIIVAMWSNLDAPYLDVPPARRQLLKETRNGVVTAMVETDITNAFLGKGEVNLTVELTNETPSSFINWAIPATLMSDFEAQLKLPEGYHLAKTKILESDAESDYYLTLNITEPKDAIEGQVARWSVYIDNGEGHPRTLVIDLMTEDAALNPVSLINLPTIVSHNLADNQLSTTLSSETIDFSATIPMEGAIETLQTLDWVESGEIVCYRNGICDKLYIDGGSLAPLLEIDPAAAKIQASTPWSEFISGEPTSILVRTNPQIFVRQPWYNVQTPQTN